ncbi:ATP phosphoribosyltransferase domain-containing protein [Trichoderma afarasin]
MGITSVDQVQEHEAASQSDFDDKTLENRSSRINVILRLGFGDCQLQVQVQDKRRLKHSKELIDYTVGTSFVHLTRQDFTRLEAEHCPESLRERGLQTQIMLTGSVEAACALSVADGAVGLVESGTTMKVADLRAIDTITELVFVPGLAVAVAVVAARGPRGLVDPPLERLRIGAASGEPSEAKAYYKSVSLLKAKRDMNNHTPATPATLSLPLPPFLSFLVFVLILLGPFHQSRTLIQQH